VRTNMQHTSLDAYEEITTKPTVLGTRQTAVYQVLAAAPEPLTLKETASALGWAINCVTGRLKELRDRKLIMERGHRLCSLAGRYVHVWGPPGPVVDAPRPTSTRGAKTTRPRKSKVTPIAVIPSAERGKPIQLALELPQKAA